MVLLSFWIPHLQAGEKHALKAEAAEANADYKEVGNPFDELFGSPVRDIRKLQFGKRTVYLYLTGNWTLPGSTWVEDSSVSWT